jgi:plasmid stabilization system protein ParE
MLDTALADLKELQRYIATESGNRTVGKLFATKIMDQCEKMASLSTSIGRPRPELRADMRSFPFKGYIIFFRYQNDRLEVVNILEGHRDIEAYFQDNDC